jgi:hypothetical protein
MERGKGVMSIEKRRQESYCKTQQAEIELAPNCLFYLPYSTLQGRAAPRYPVHDVEDPTKSPWRLVVQKNPALAGTVLGLRFDSDLAQSNQ